MLFYLGMILNDPTTLEYHRRLLDLPKPWEVEFVELNSPEKTVHISITYPTGTFGYCPVCNQLRGIHDRRQRKWRHLATMTYKTIITCDVPRIDCEDHGVHLALVPWAEPKGRFTLDFENYAIQIIKAASNLKEVMLLLGISWDTVQSIQSRAVERGLLRRADTPIKHLGIDEKSFRSRHRYSTIIGDLEKGTVIDVVQGRDKEGAEKAFESLSEVQKEGVEAIAMDLWGPFQEAAKKYLPNADIVHDKYHVMSYLGKAIDQVRKGEHKQLLKEGDETLTNTKYLWLTNPKNWTEIQRQMYHGLKDQSLKVGIAFAIREQFRNFWGYSNAKSASNYFKKWYYWATHSQLKPVIKQAKSLNRHISNILTYFRHRISNGTLEGLNSKIQVIKSAARGFRNHDNWKVAILFHCGGLDLRPHKCR